MNSAKSWLARARGVRAVRTPLKKMREVLHSGQRLGTTLAEVDELRGEIRRREWEENARRVSNSLPRAAATMEPATLACPPELHALLAMQAEQFSYAQRGLYKRSTSPETWLSNVRIMQGSLRDAEKAPP